MEFQLIFTCGSSRLIIVAVLILDNCFHNSCHRHLPTQAKLYRQGRKLWVHSVHDALKTKKLMGTYFVVRMKPLSHTQTRNPSYFIIAVKSSKMDGLSHLKLFSCEKELKNIEVFNTDESLLFSFVGSISLL